MEPSLNVLGGVLQLCCSAPLTGFYRDGKCNTSDEDLGRHTVCCLMSDEFLKFSKSCGNDLTTPVPEFGFEGLKEGDLWCLCAQRWKEAYEAGVAPHIVLAATHQRTLDCISLDILRKFSLD